MPLTFLTPLMLAGAALIAVPIILHLVMRQQPKHLIFPALRFIRQRNDANKRRLKLRHILLLALRCGAIVLLALALARPSVQSAGFLGDREAPVAAALVFDTSPRMQYRNENQTRLQSAQQVAEKVLKQLPRDSDVAIIDSRPIAPAFSIDAAAAGQRIAQLAVTGAAEPLPEMCLEALRLVGENKNSRKEIYVFTDLARTAWSAESVGRLRAKLAEKSEAVLYVVDVGAQTPQNVALGDIRLSADLLSKNTPLQLETDLVCTGQSTEERTVALELIDSAGKPQRRSQISVKPSPDQPQPVDLQIGSLELGTHQGLVRIVGEDALPADDVRYFTVEVRPAWRILIAASKENRANAAELAEALAPSPRRRTGQSRFDCQIVSLAELANKTASQSLDDYAAICLVDPPPLSDSVWQSLTTYVERGGGLGIWLGPTAQPAGRTPDDFNSKAAEKLMPGKLSRIWRRQDAFLAPPNYQHPLLAAFRSQTGGVPWSEFLILTHWQLSDLVPGVSTVIPYNNGQAALLERSVGNGRVLVFTTPISAEATETDLWNTLVVGSGSWPFMMLRNEMLIYLAGSGAQRLNYAAGETATLELPEAERQMFFSLRTPPGEELSPRVDQKTGLLSTNSTSATGNYLLRSGGTDSGIRRGFSVNISAASTELTRLTPDDFVTALGKDRVRLSRGQQEIERQVNLGRTGQELYPLLVLLVALILGGEHLLANKFHRRDTQADQPSRRSLVAQLAAETKQQQESVAAI